MIINYFKLAKIYRNGLYIHKEIHPQEFHKKQ